MRSCRDFFFSFYYKHCHSPSSTRSEAFNQFPLTTTLHGYGWYTGVDLVWSLFSCPLSLIPCSPRIFGWKKKSIVSLFAQNAFLRQELLVSEILTTLCNESKMNTVIIEFYVQLLCLWIKVLMSHMCSLLILFFLHQALYVVYFFRLTFRHHQCWDVLFLHTILQSFSVQSERFHLRSR